MRGLASIFFVLSATTACAPDVGDCDRVAAREIVYTAEGAPAYAGQALIIQSCGGGGFCHAEDTEPGNGFGVPAGLSFDLGHAASDAEVARLDASQLRVLEMHAAILDQVQRGAMPPPARTEALRQAYASFPRYDRVDETGEIFTPLPDVGSDEGVDILRNWLACGAPVVERTTPAVERGAPIGFTVAACPRRCVEPTWPDIAAHILSPTCATSACHDAQEPGGGLDLSLVDPSDPAQLAALRSALAENAAGGRRCVDSPVADAPLIAPHDPDGSLLIQKVTPELLACGSLMPLSGAELGPQRRCALREWVACGACADPDDPDCAACQEAARATCGVTIDAETGEPACVEQVACPRY